MCRLLASSLLPNHDETLPKHVFAAFQADKSGGMTQRQMQMAPDQAGAIWVEQRIKLPCMPC